MNCRQTRFPVCRLIVWKETRCEVTEAENSATGIKSSEILIKPFQFARGGGIPSDGADRCGIWSLRAPPRRIAVLQGARKGRKRGGRLKLGVAGKIGQVTVAGRIARPWQFRRPVATIRSFLPSGSKARTSARGSSVSQVAPRSRVLIHSCNAPLMSGCGNIFTATFDPEPTERSNVLPSGEKTMSRAQ